MSTLSDNVIGVMVWLSERYVSVMDVMFSGYATKAPYNIIRARIPVFKHCGRLVTSKEKEKDTNIIL